MTKVRDLTRPIEGEEKKLKPIEFVMECKKDEWHINPECEPSEWENIELISREFNNDLDLMFAYDDYRSSGVLYLGHFNDGIVE
jgi:hypothetical protein